MKRFRKILEIDEQLCNGCGQCILACAEGALTLENGKAKVISDNLCDGLGACIGECPTGALKIVEREADDFNAQTVRLPHECPSSRIFQKVAQSGTDSNFFSWPVKIRLIPENAFFLKGTDLLVVADCVPVAFPHLYEKFIGGKVVMAGCPKFDEVNSYVEKFSRIFRDSGIKHITVVTMEVPCCSGLPRIIKKGVDLAGKNIPLEVVVISTRGGIIEQEEFVCL